MSVVKEPGFCICVNIHETERNDTASITQQVFWNTIGANELYGNRDKVFIIASTIILLFKPKHSSPEHSSVAVRPGLHLTWSVTLKTDHSDI